MPSYYHLKAVSLAARLLAKPGHLTLRNCLKPLGALVQIPQRRLLQSSTRTEPRQDCHGSTYRVIQLPHQCSGCGALAQTSDDEELGFYSLGRRSVKAFLYANTRQNRIKSDEVQNIELLQKSEGEILGSTRIHSSIPLLSGTSTPLCDRCHRLLHHESGVSINHPSIELIQSLIFESPHKYNHIYHVIDAADFPMSLIPGIHRYFHLAPQRSLNRRSRTGRYYHGRKTEISFIITRSDLFAPLKAQVDSLMPYLVSVLRDALGLSGENVRLGNVRCVSAKRSWWTKELKEDIWSRGGGSWMVGKVNVGKSQLFESVFPKGRGGTTKIDGNLLPVFQHCCEHGASENGSMESNHSQDCRKSSATKSYGGAIGYKKELLDSSLLLPPLPPETNYPDMPLVSALPGTTATPIRLPFGNGKGELVDLPGLSRSDLELHVQHRYRSSLLMRSRVLPRQQVIKPGQSLLLGGFIRITPFTPGVIILAYAFTPILSHLTATEKAISIQTQKRESGTQNISDPGVGAKIGTAGRFPLKWDVTIKRTGPITNRSAAGIKVDRLPYRVLSTDILIEGCGWIELVAQVRKREFESRCPTDGVVDNNPEGECLSSEAKWPEVEVFSPEGKFIGSRRPLGAWAMGEKKNPASSRGRPRRSMKGMKKKMKALQKMN